MFSPIITPSQIADTFASGSASRMGATIGTTTTAISMKSRKNPSAKITSITTMNWVQNPPGREDRKCRTISSPPNALKAAVSMAAPSRMMNTMEVVFALSTTTPRRVSPIRQTRRSDQPMATPSPATASPARATPRASDPVSTARMLRSKRPVSANRAAKDRTARMAGW